MTDISLHSEMSRLSEMNFIPKRCPVICHIEKEGAVSFENERDGINLQRNL